MRIFDVIWPTVQPKQPPNLQTSLQQMSRQLQDLQLKNQCIPQELKKDIDILADRFRMISMGSSPHSNSSNSLHDPAVISYTKKEEPSSTSSNEFMDMAPIETLEKNDSIIEIWYGLKNKQTFGCVKLQLEANHF